MKYGALTLTRTRKEKKGINQTSQRCSHPSRPPTADGMIPTPPSSFSLPPLLQHERAEFEKFILYLNPGKISLIRKRGAKVNSNQKERLRN